MTAMRRFHLGFAILALLATVASPRMAYADCTSPAGVESKMIWDWTNHVMKICDGTNWLSMSSGSSSGSAGYIQFSNGSGGFSNSGTTAGQQLFWDDTNKRLGIGTATPTHALTFPSSSTGIALYNTADQTTNFERGSLAWSANELTLGVQPGGTGTARDLALKALDDSSNGMRLNLSPSPPYLQFRNNSTAGTTDHIRFTSMSTNAGLIASANGQTFFNITPYVTQTGTAGYTALKVNPRENSLGSGNSYIADFQVTGASKMVITNMGRVGIGTTTPASAFAIDQALDALANTALASNYLAYIRNYSTTSGQGAGLAFAVDTNASSANIGGAIIFKRTTTASQGELQFYTKQTITSGAAPTQAMVISDTGKVGIGTTSPSAKFQVAGAIVSTASNVASGASVDLSTSNTITLAAIGGSNITLSNMVHGGNYTLIVQDTTSRTYTFSGCNTSKFRPANAATTAASQTIYNIVTIYNGATYDCYITWTTGYL